MDLDKNNEITEKILDLYRQGMSIEDIAKKCRAEKWAVQCVLRVGATDDEAFDRLSNTLREYLTVVHDDVKRQKLVTVQQRPDLN